MYLIFLHISEVAGEAIGQSRGDGAYSRVKRTSSMVLRILQLLKVSLLSRSLSGSGELACARRSACERAAEEHRHRWGRFVLQEQGQARRKSSVGSSLHKLLVPKGKV